MPPFHDVHVLSIKAKLSSEEASDTGVLSVGVQSISQQHPQEASPALAHRFRVHTSDPCRVCIGRWVSEGRSELADP